MLGRGDLTSPAHQSQHHGAATRRASVTPEPSELDHVAVFSAFGLHWMLPKSSDLKCKLAGSKETMWSLYESHTKPRTMKLLPVQRMYSSSPLSSKKTIIFRFLTCTSASRNSATSQELGDFGCKLRSLPKSSEFILSFGDNLRTKLRTMAKVPAEHWKPA